MSKAWIFDFDGTLVHSEALITQCFERITKKLAPRRLSVAKQIHIGPPLRHSVAEILGSPKHPLIDEFVTDFIHMHDNEILNHTSPYPSVHETLVSLHEQGEKMAIATNKRLAPTKKILEYLNWNKFFIFVECSDSESVIRNKKKMIQAILEKDSDFKGAYFIGDTVGDGLAAEYNNLSFICARYGYGNLENWEDIRITSNIKAMKDILKINI